MGFFEFILTCFALFGIILIRYFIFAGGAYIIWWKWKREAWFHKRIQLKYPSSRLIRKEIQYSVATSMIFAVTGGMLFWAWKEGYTQVYLDIHQYGWPYFFFSIVVMILFHETYFYWTHRLMHLKAFYMSVHKIHHDSNNPSPMAAFSFHPYEGLIEAGFLPILALIMPAHPAAILFFLTFMTVLSVINHLGYEVYPHWFSRNWLMKGLITSTHHNMHHSKLHCNYGLYFTWWDFIMKTHHPDYEKLYDEVHSRTPETVKSIRSELGSSAQILSP